jgi:hypothetical protein
MLSEEHIKERIQKIASCSSGDDVFCEIFDADGHSVKVDELVEKHYRTDPHSDSSAPLNGAETASSDRPPRSSEQTQESCQSGKSIQEEKGSTQWNLFKEEDSENDQPSEEQEKEPESSPADQTEPSDIPLGENGISEHRISTHVINIKHNPSAYYVYIGRANKRYGLEESKWANPYKIGKDGTRQEVIEKYRAYIKSRPDLLASLSDLEGQPLGCWCAPEPCHGDVLIELLQEQQSTSQSKNEESSRDATMPKSLYKFSKGVWKCRNCFQNGDLQSMIDHVEHCSHDKDLNT